MVVITLVAFFIVPAVFLSVFVFRFVGLAILLPIPMIILAIRAYITWRRKEHSNAQRLMNAAAQPVTPESRSFLERGTPQQAPQVGSLPTAEKKKVTAVTTVSHQDGGANEIP